MPPLKRLKPRSELSPTYLASRPDPSPPKSLIIKLPIRFFPPTTPDRSLLKLKPRFRSPSPSPSPEDETEREEETIYTLRQKCWLLDQLRIYGSIAAQQKAAIAKTKQESGEVQDLACPYVLSEFSIEERNRAGLDEDEEFAFLTRKKAELEMGVFGVSGFESLDFVDADTDADVERPVLGGKSIDVSGRPIYGGKSVDASGNICAAPKVEEGQKKVAKKHKRRKRRVSFDGCFVPEPLEEIEDSGVYGKPKRKPRGGGRKPVNTSTSGKIVKMPVVKEEENAEDGDGEFVPLGEEKPKKRQSLLTAGKFGKVTKNLGGGKLAVKGNINLSFQK